MSETGDKALQEAFRLAMRRVASTVSIVSAQIGGERRGTTATSVTSISMDPPSLLICLNRSSRLHDFLLAQDRFCVNVLHTDNFDTSRIFSDPSKGAERFDSGDWRSDAEGTPYLADAQANFFCVREKEIAYGSHTIFIGRVVNTRMRDDISPLLYRDGRYSGCAPLAGPSQGPPK